MKELFLRLDSGSEKGRLFKVTSMGMRLGRSSSNDIHVPDEELSRNHCLFELSSSGTLRLTDLASANGTYLNGELIGTDTKELKEGDEILVGNTLLTVVDSEKPKPIELKLPSVETKVSGVKKVDLGLTKRDDLTSETKDVAPQEHARPKWLNYLWAGVIILMALAALALLLDPAEVKKSEISLLATQEESELPQVLRAFSFEKIDADQNRIFRYFVEIDEAGKISLQLDDVPQANRHVRKSGKLSDKAIDRLIEFLCADEVSSIEREYTGESAMTINELKSAKICFNIDGVIKSFFVENAPESDAFRNLREKIETFVNNELGVWSIQYPKEKLLEMSKASKELGDSKWEERDVEFGNIAAAIKSYNESIFYLDTINPKPEWFNSVREALRTANAELDNRYKNQLFKADRAINIGHWEEAITELRILLEMIPDSEDERYQTAERKLLDVTKRVKGGR